MCLFIKLLIHTENEYIKNKLSDMDSLFSSIESSLLFFLNTEYNGSILF